MDKMIFPRPLYLFLKTCNETSLERIVLDCGAGGSCPPLSLFYEFGYRSHGIEQSEEQLIKAQAFAEKEQMDLQLIQGDMCELPYQDQSFNFLYSWNTTVHMDKADVKKALRESWRVLVPGGLCYMNFLSRECDTYGIGKHVGEGVFEVDDGDAMIRFSHYEFGEPEEYFEGFKVIYREQRVVTRFEEREQRKSGFYDYILKKQ